MSDVALLRPLRMRGRWLRNRIVLGPHETNLARRRDISRRHVAYYTRRARGGVGLVVTESASVHPSDWPYERAPLAEDCGAGWRAVAASCREEGALVLAGLSHAGSQGSSAYSQRELWAPSSVPDVASREVPKEMEEQDIAAVVAGFAASAALAVECGLDGVEVNAGQHSLLRQYLSGLTNLRTDAYADRPRFAEEVLAAVRAAVPEAVVGLRLSCDELAPWAGITPESAGPLAVRLSAHVDYVAVVRGSAMGTSATRPDGHTPAGFNLDLARTVRTALRDAGASAAVLAQGSIVDVAQAEAAVDDAADLVEMTRALLADANLPRKVAQGQSERVRPCILCNQSCMVRDPRNPIVSCVADPRTGHEWHQPTIMNVPPVRRQVTIVGAGPAGLEAARVAGTRGHTVRVYEQSTRLGGALASAAAAGAGRERLALLTDWLAKECRHLGVRVELGTRADADLLRGLGTDVILATGSLPGIRAYELADASAGSVRTVRDVLEALQSAGADTLPEGPVVVWDPIGGPIGISAAETLAGLGREVALVTPDPVAGNELSRSGDLASANTRLQVAGVTIARRCTLRAVEGGYATIANRLTGEVRRLPAGLVVDAGFRLPDERLWSALSEDTLRAGDEVAPRTVYEALLEARSAVMELDSRPMPRPRPRVGRSHSMQSAVPAGRSTASSAGLEGVAP